MNNDRNKSLNTQLIHDSYFELIDGTLTYFVTFHPPQFCKNVLFSYCLLNLIVENIQSLLSTRFLMRNIKRWSVSSDGGGRGGRQRRRRLRFMIHVFYVLGEKISTQIASD